MGECPQEAFSAELRIATCNALTLRDDVQRRCFASQARQHHLAAFGLQETRAQATNVREQLGFIIASSSCDHAGRFGCELWLDLSAVWAWVGDSPIKLDTDSVSIVYSDPRRLLVSVRAGRVAFSAAVLHSPHKGSP